MRVVRQTETWGPRSDLSESHDILHENAPPRWSVEMSGQEAPLDLETALRKISELAETKSVKIAIEGENPIERAKKKAQAIYKAVPQEYQPAIKTIEAKKSSQSVLDLLTAATLIPSDSEYLPAIMEANGNPFASEFWSHRLNIPIGFIALRQVLPII